MTQPNGLSPRANKQNSVVGEGSSTRALTPTSVNRPRRFFEEDQLKFTVTGRMLKGHNSKPRSSTPAKLHMPNQSRNQCYPTARVLGILATSLAIVPWLYVRAGSVPALPSVKANTKSSLRSLASTESLDRCAARRAWGGVSTEDRLQCAAVLPEDVIERDGWLVAVHVDRKPSSAPPVGTKLRGATSTHRDLPHQYFVRAMEATLHSIATVDPAAVVDIALFTEDRWGGLVDDMGVPVEWDVPTETCGDLGLHCMQSMVSLNDHDALPDAVECVGSADVFVGSESDFSQASAALSTHVKVMTDKWESNQQEMIIALNPATTVAGMSSEKRKQLRQTMGEYRECSELAEAKV